MQVLTQDFTDDGFRLRLRVIGWEVSFVAGHHVVFAYLRVSRLVAALLRSLGLCTATWRNRLGFLNAIAKLQVMADWGLALEVPSELLIFQVGFVLAWCLLLVFDGPFFLLSRLLTSCDDQVHGLSLYHLSFGKLLVDKSAYNGVDLSRIADDRLPVRSVVFIEHV